MPSLPNRFYHWIRHPSAHSLAGEEQTTRGFEHLAGSYVLPARDLEAALRASYGLGRQAYERASGALGASAVYLEIIPR